MGNDESLLWLARSGGMLKFSPVAMPSGVPAHANAGYALTAAVPGPDGRSVTAETFVGSFDARSVGFSRALDFLVTDLKAQANAPAPVRLLRSRTSVPTAAGRAA